MEIAIRELCIYRPCHQRSQGAAARIIGFQSWFANLTCV